MNKQSSALRLATTLVDFSPSEARAITHVAIKVMFNSHGSKLTPEERSAAACYEGVKAAGLETSRCSDLVAFRIALLEVLSSEFGNRVDMMLDDEPRITDAVVSHLESRKLKAMMETPAREGRETKSHHFRKEQRRPILCLDFDGVLHSYSSGWQGADVILDPPVDSAQEFVRQASKPFHVVVFSSRSNQPGGIDAMRTWCAKHGFPVDKMTFATEKPPATVSIDDRAITFTGKWPSVSDLMAFTPWNKE